MFFREPVVDTNVLVDMAIPSRPRHSVACRLTSFFEREGIKPWVPAHGIFELHAAIVDEGLSEPQDPTVFPSDDHPVQVHLVNIDHVFIRLYLGPRLPRLRSGDLIFVALALGEGRELITEDAEVLGAATGAGVHAVGVEMYLSEHGDYGSSQ